MGIDRRKFLKIAGVSSLVTLGGGASLLALNSPAGASHGEVEHHAEGEEVKAPEKGVKRWGMVIDMRKCSEHKDCTKCIDACHYVHNVPHFENRKEEVKWIWKEEYEKAFTDIGTLHKYNPKEIVEEKFLCLCNHCDHPPCVRVCPTKATFRRPDGIVAMDYHRCIGCRFCMAACPYGSRSFNWKDPRLGLRGRKLNPEFPTRMRGVVEKCNFCVERLAQGLKPACVEACPDGVLVFGDLNDPDSEIRKVLAENYTVRRKPELGTAPSVFYII